MRNIILLLICTLAFTFSSCSSQNEDLAQDVGNNDLEAFCDSIQLFSIETKGIIDSLAEKSFNYNTQNTRAQKLDEDSLNNLVTKLSVKTETFLIDNNVDVDSIYIEGGNKEKIAYIGLMLLDYEKLYTTNYASTRASIGDCVLRGTGIGELFSNKVLTKRAVMRIIIKAGLKRAAPYVGWGLFLGETAACLAGY